jgi:hypothetical protein
MVGVDRPLRKDCLSVNVGVNGLNDGRVWANDGYDVVPYHMTSPNFQRAFSYLVFNGDFA